MAMTGIRAPSWKVSASAKEQAVKMRGTGKGGAAYGTGQGGNGARRVPWPPATIVS